MRVGSYIKAVFLCVFEVSWYLIKSQKYTKIVTQKVLKFNVKNLVDTLQYLILDN